MQEWSKIIHERSPDTVRAAQTVSHGRDWLVRSGLGRWLFGLILGIGLALVGPFGTFTNMGLGLRLGYWVTIALVSFAIWWAVESALDRLLGPRGLIVEQLTVIVPFAALNSVFLSLAHMGVNAATGMNIPDSWTYYFFSHILLSSLVIAPLIWLARTLITQVQTRASSDTIQFLTQALPPHMRGQPPYALAAEGHYVRVYTSTGNTLVTMRFEDAVRALSGVDGIQTHRSWWVAFDHVVDVQPLGSAYEATLRSGMTVPISRRRKALVSKGLTDIGRQPA